MKTEYDLCIIGGGAAGLVVAAGAATFGAKVILIEKQALGGDCLHYGCIPSKALIHSAKVANTVRDGQRFGIDSKLPAIHLAKVMQRVQAVIRHIEPNDSPERFKALGVELCFGAGHFTEPRVFTINNRSIRAKNFVLAAGSRPAIPDIPGLENISYLTNETLFSVQEDIPHLIILGGGPIGCELAQSLGRLGSRITLIDQAAGLLPREDEDMSAIIQAKFLQENIDLELGIKVLKIEQQGTQIQVLLQRPDKGEYWLTGSHLLIAGGRKANLESLDLEQAGVMLDNGRLVLDGRLRTSNKHIYACGDITGGYQFTHMAEHQAGVVLKNCLFHWPAKAQIRNIPWCTYTDPELARVGLSETDVRQQGLAHQVYRFPFAEIDRAITEGETIGMAKIITTPRGKLLGACIAGAHAGELIAEYVMAISKGMTATDISNTLHIYPTLAQINRRVADQRLKAALTPQRQRWLKRLLRLRG